MNILNFQFDQSDFPELLILRSPPGLDINSTTGIISGVPTASGSFISRLETSNESGTFAKDIQFVVTDFSGWKYSTSVNFQATVEVLNL